MGFNQLHALVEQYLIDQGIDPQQKFCCPNPDHDEKTPSANVWKHGVKCHGCKGYFNIFELTHFLEGLPPKGSPSFFQGNVAVLAKRYGIPLPGWSQSKIPSIYSAVIEYCLNTYAERCAREEGINKEELIYKRWLLNPAFEDLQRKNHVFLRAPDAEELGRHLQEKGFDPEDISRAGIDRYLFPGGNAPVYPLWLSNSVCVGFSNKNPYWEPGQKRKYVNSPNNNTFQKKEFLYGLFLNPRFDKKLFIVEGQKDVLACWLKDYQAVSGLTSGLTSEQKSILLTAGYSDITLLYDGDNGGRGATVKDIVEFLRVGTVPNIVLLPQGSDPYSYLVEDGHDLLPKAEDGLVYYSDVFLSELEDSLKINTVIDIICAIPRQVKREIMSTRFAEVLGVSASALANDVEEEVEARKRNANERAVQAMESALVNAKNNPEAFISLMESALVNAKSYQSNVMDFSNANLHEAIAEIKQGVADKSYLDVPFRERGLRFLFDTLHRDGLGYSEKFIGLVAADPHVGKTALLLQHCAETLISGERQDQEELPETMCIYFSTDDTLSLLIPRLLASTVFHYDFLISDSYRADEYLTPKKRRAKDVATLKLSQWVNSERLVMKDMEWSTRLSDLGLMVSYYREKYPKRRIYVYVDNLYRCSDHNMRDENTAAGLLVGDAKAIASLQKASFWCSAEYRKTKDSGTKTRTGRSNSDLFGSRVVQYHAMLIVHLHNDKIGKGGDVSDSEWVHYHNGKELPRIVMTIGKNKVNGWTGSQYLDSYPGSSYFTYPDQEQALSEHYERLKMLEKMNE